jgi:hypothetical protein
MPSKTPRNAQDPDVPVWVGERKLAACGAPLRRTGEDTRPYASIASRYSSVTVSLFHVLPSGFILFKEADSLPLVMIPFRLCAFAAGSLGAVLGGYFLFRPKPKTAKELEIKRREWLDQVGRITDGTVIDVQEQKASEENFSTFLIFQYDVAGVSYEASQDVTYLRQRINLHSCRLGVPTSVRYDPHNPGNSIVVSERWMGLR